MAHRFFSFVHFYWSLLKAAVEKFFTDDLFTRAAALSYYTIFSLPPMLLVILYTTTIFYDWSTMQHTIYGQLAYWIGPKSAGQLWQTVYRIGLFEGKWWASVIGLVGLLVTSTTVFVTIQEALNKIFGVKPKPDTSTWLVLLRNRILSFALLLGIAFVMIVSLVVNALISAFGSYAAQFLPTISTVLVGIASIVVPFVIITLLFAMIFKVLPDADIPWRDIWRGAMITSILFYAGKYLISFYIGRAQAVDFYEAAGSVMVILLWVYYASAIFFFGAAFTAVYVKKVEDGITPRTYAVRIKRQIIEERKKEKVVDTPS